MQTRPLRIGFAGASAKRGWAKDAHLAAVKAIPELEIFGVSARSQANADAAAGEFGAARAYADTLAMAIDPDIDIIAVTTRVSEHAHIVLAALNAGKHVYCEWPLGRDLAEAEEMAFAARCAGTHVMIGLQALQAPAVRHAAHLVRMGVIGKPLNLRVVSPTAGWGAQTPLVYAYLQEKASGATLATIAGGHTLAAIEAVIGPYEEVTAMNSILRGSVEISDGAGVLTRTCSDHVLVLGRHTGGTVSSLEVLGGTSDTPFRFELRGTLGTLEITGNHPGGYQVSNLQLSVSPPQVPQPELSSLGLAKASINVFESWNSFQTDIRQNTHTVPDFADAVRLTALLDAIDLASAEGRRVSLKD